MGLPMAAFSALDILLSQGLLEPLLDGREVARVCLTASRRYEQFAEVVFSIAGDWFAYEAYLDQLVDLAFWSSAADFAVRLWEWEAYGDHTGDFGPSRSLRGE